MNIVLAPPPKPGRPPRHPVDILRTQLWFHVVKLRSGLPSAYAIELALEPEAVRRNADGTVLRPRKWDAYEKGNRVPKRMANKPYAIDLAEAHFPGAARYFEAAIWPVLRKETVTRNWLDSQLRQLDETVMDILLHPDMVGLGGELHFADFDQASANRLTELGSFDALTAVVLLVAKSELISSPDLREFALNSYFGMLPALEINPVTAPFMKEICHRIDLVCKQWIFLGSQARMDVVIFTSEMPRVKTCTSDDAPS